jgi:hypothetical protein
MRTIVSSFQDVNPEQNQRLGAALQNESFGNVVRQVGFLAASDYSE